MSSTNEAILEEIKTDLRELRAALDEHTRVAHAELVARSEIEAADGETLAIVQENQRQLSDLADAFLGTPKRNFDGQIERSGGLQEVLSAYQNGGFKVKLPTWLKTTIGTIITALGGIIVALINHTPTP